jgi:hypothetical protein
VDGSGAAPAPATTNSRLLDAVIAVTEGLSGQADAAVDQLVRRVRAA